MTTTKSQGEARGTGDRPMVDAALVGIPFDLGAPRRGSGLATRAIRYAGLMERLASLGLHVLDMGDVPVPEDPVPSSDRLRNLAAVVEVSQTGCDAARRAVMTGKVGVFLGGDHSVAMGTIAGVADAYHARGERIGLIWFDAHGDFNDEHTTPSGFLHGMPFAIALGIGAPELTQLAGFAPKVLPENAVLIGARDVDPGEQRLIERAGLMVFTMDDVERLGLPEVVDRAMAIAGRGTAAMHVSVDMDALDPLEAPGVGSPVRNGLTARETRDALRRIAASGRLASLDMVEVDPLLDQRNESARIAVDLIAAALSP